MIELQQAKDSLERLCLLITKIDKEFKKDISFKYRFFSGLFIGLATAISTTIILSIAIKILHSLFKIDWIKPIIKEILKMVEHGKKH